VPHSFTDYDPEPEPQSSGRFGGGPPKRTGIGVLDPPTPPRNPANPARNSLRAFFSALKKFFGRR
jgi:hypothetical protein